MKLSLIICLAFITVSCAQDKVNRTTLGINNARAELKQALSNVNAHNVINNKSVIIKDSITAIAIAEPLLFSIYGRKNIISQRPYDIYQIDNYWVLSGTLPKDSAGGTFLIITDDRNGKVVRVTHGK